MQAFRVTRTQIALAAIVLLALGLRGAWLATTDTALPPLSDPQYYHATATNLAEGRGYSVAVRQPSGSGVEWGFVAGPESEATAFWSPGYPFVLAPLYKLFGPDERIAKALNAIAGALTVVPIFYVGRRVGHAGSVAVSRETSGIPSDDSVGLLAALLFAIAPSLVFWTSSLFSEALFTFGVASAFAVAIWAGERRSIAAYIIAGIVLAATAFVRAQGLLFAVPLLVLIWPSPDPAREDPSEPYDDALTATRWALRDLRGLRGSTSSPSRSQRLRHALPDAARVIAPVLAGAALLVIPWAIRNDIAMDAPSIITDSAGYNLRLAHAPYSTGTSTPPRDLWDEQPGISFREREIFWRDVGTGRALTYAREHPGREAQLAALRISWLLRSDAEPAIRWAESLGATPFGRGRDAWVLAGDVYWYALLALAAQSLAIVRRGRVWWALWSAIGVWLALHLVFSGEPRYHVPLMPALVILAAAVIMTVASRFRMAAPRPARGGVSAQSPGVVR